MTKLFSVEEIIKVLGRKKTWSVSEIEIALDCEIAERFKREHEELKTMKEDFDS
jgi:hypothetical protein